MKRFISLFVILIMLFSATTVLAHSGRTDGSGGHYDHSTGEYHYHHGYPAHQHKNGVCPYKFDDKTGQNSGGSSGSSKGRLNSNPDDPTVYYVLFGAVGIGLLIWFIRKVRREKKEARSSSPAPEQPTSPVRRSKPVRLVSPDSEPNSPPTPSPISYRPRPDLDSVLTVKDIMPPPLKKTPPVAQKLEYSKPKASNTLTLKAHPIPSSVAYQPRDIQPTSPKSATSSSSTAIDPNHYTFAMREVKSSNIHSIGYSNGTLTVRFHSGREYVYFDVSISEYFSFINAPSVGKYYNEHIRQKYRGDFIGIKDTKASKITNPT